MSKKQFLFILILLVTLHDALLILIFLYSICVLSLTSFCSSLPTYSVHISFLKPSPYFRPYQITTVTFSTQPQISPYRLCTSRFTAANRHCTPPYRNLASISRSTSLAFGLTACTSFRSASRSRLGAKGWNGTHLSWAVGGDPGVG